MNLEDRLSSLLRTHGIRPAQVKESRADGPDLQVVWDKAGQSRKLTLCLGTADAAMDGQKSLTRQVQALQSPAPKQLG